MTRVDPRTEPIFAAALEIADDAERRDYIARCCGKDAQLAGEVESLVAAHQQAVGFLESPVCDDPAIPSLATRGASTNLTPGALAGRRFGDYELVHEIARGGMGIVYKARQLSLNRFVALKMILAGPRAGVQEIKRFRLEAEAAARLVHPNIVSIYEVGEHEGQPYFSMRYVEGRSLYRIVEDGVWPLDDGQATTRLIAQVARTVYFAHERGIVHRDLKPANILIDANGEPHITDFGLARVVASDSTLTLTGAVMGTPSFMAPEQAAGRFHELTPAADVYSLGAVLYYLLTGRPPFFAETPLDILVQVLDRDALRPRALNPRVSRDLERVCLRCLEKSPARRYPSAVALAEDLERCLRGEPLEVPPGDATSRLHRWARREPALVARLFTLALCASISHVTHLVGPHGDSSRHDQVMIVLGLWTMACILCHQGLRRPRWANPARLAWVGADVAFLTAILHIDAALESPLVALYPALIVGSGLWFRVALVRLTTQLSALGYGSLMAAEYWRLGQLPHPHWHLIFLAVLALIGFIVAYHVHRVSVLGRLCERRSLS